LKQPWDTISERLRRTFKLNQYLDNLSLTFSSIRRTPRSKAKLSGVVAMRQNLPLRSGFYHCRASPLRIANDKQTRMSGKNFSRLMFITGNLPSLRWPIDSQRAENSGGIILLLGQ
jgi:hypothetical protein